MIEVEQNKHAKRLLLDAKELGDGWLQAPDHHDMRVQLQALFREDSFDGLMAARLPLFLGQKLEGLDRQAGDEFVDEAYERGLMLSDGAAVPLLHRLRGLRLDVLRELAVYCECPKLTTMIDDLEPEPKTAPATPGNEPTRATHTTKGKRRDTLTPVIETAQKQCNEPKDTAEVWATLQVLAEKKVAPLIGATEQGLQYLKNGTCKIFTRDALRKRLGR